MEDKEKDKIVEKNDENVSKTTKKIKRTNTRKRIKAIQIEDDDIVTRYYDFNLLEVVIIIMKDYLKEKKNMILILMIK